MNGYSLRSKVLVVTEGYSEKIYFNKFRERDNSFEIIVRRCPEQRPKKILRFCLNEIKELGLDLKGGDSAYIVFDVDYNSESLINEIIESARHKNVGVIISKPCFEVFYLLHFTNNIDRLVDPEDTLDELDHYLKGYSKTEDYWRKLLPMQSEAVEKTRSFNIEDLCDLAKCRNGTDIYVFFDDIATRRSKHHPDD